jgi:hypothetical protein
VRKRARLNKNRHARNPDGRNPDGRSPHDRNPHGKRLAGKTSMPAPLGTAADASRMTGSTPNLEESITSRCTVLKL